MNGLDVVYLKDTIRKSLDSTRMHNYRLNWLYLLPKLNLSQYPYEIKKDYVLFGGGNGRMMLPLTCDSNVVYRSMLKELESGGLANIPHFYCNGLSGLYSISPRMWGERDFVIETKTLIELGGKRLGNYRNMRNRYSKSDDISILTLRDNLHIRDEFIKAIYLWHKEVEAIGIKKAVGRMQYPVWVVENFESLARIIDLKGFGVYDNRKKKMIGFSLGVEHSNDYWVNTFRFTSREYSSLSAYLWSEIARHFQNYPYELDGDAGG